MPVRAEPIDADAVLFHGAAYDSTSLTLFDGDRALLVEGLASAADAEALRATLTREMGKRVALLISTHYFSDHLAAWNLFPDAPVLAHENAAATFWNEQFRTAAEAAHYRAPTFLLSGRLEIAWGRFRLDVFENHGHTTGTLNVDIPALDLLHVGDTAVGRMVYLQYSAPEAIDRALGRALGRGRRRVLRSHGGLTGPETLASARGYLANLEARVAEARRAARPIDTIRIEDCLPPGPPPTDFESFFHARNLASIEARGLYSEAA
jgi:glyoxylase-like metal-dependent hydrolase (beta-lactamase superfamily II)